MKKIYTNPTFDIERVMVEEGIAVSPVWGEEGVAGQVSDYLGEDPSSDDFWY